ncbi:hypothetical protein AB835_04540 [Candidatus Endobugula sertula]|uniref:HTH cro/C1-type domain-containing protein n=1 Tax=Candidatus Endobugula sertula TaxID=62101 RepID=A0A1D2QRS7_9GAMM|nr:hypothetical protein AB835_04540 [Candidatus Endobugula sertula]
MDKLGPMKHPKFAKRFNQAVSLAGVKNTQRALSKLLGVSEVMIWSYKNGEKLPRMAMAVKIADELGVSVNWLLQGIGDPIKQATEGSSTKSKPRRKSVQAIVDFTEKLSEHERRKALKILNITFQKNV